uniref:RNA helicase n=1 Tax=Kalanchoe fedtschenkoi TaxID=63787 RepID=A0A7N1A962_KALFE
MGMEKVSNSKRSSEEAQGAVEEVAALRKRSRQEYLKKREHKKLQELKDDVEDELCLFDESDVTVPEQYAVRYKKEVYDVAIGGGPPEEQHLNAYMIPESYDADGRLDQVKRFAVVNKRNDSGRKTSQALQQASCWEEQQIKNAYVSKSTKQESHYDFVFDDQIEVVKRCPDESRIKPPVKVSKKPSWKQLQEERRRLPVYSYKHSLLQAIEKYQIIVIMGETGSGKTTQIPQYLHEAGYTNRGIIACTQPRRVAAMSVAARVSQEMGVKLGHEVGYSVRFEDCTSDKTVVKYMTDGMLLREFLSEPDLSSYSVLMIDEAHERTVSTDLLFGLVKDIARYRPELKLLVLSATLDTAKFSDFFDSAPIFNIPGRRFPVETYHVTAPVADYVDTAVSTVIQIHVTQPPGDILVFLTGQEEIETADVVIKNRIKAFGEKIAELIVFPIYANLPTELQNKIFEPTPEGVRKIVLATNIAETSLTIDGIKYVVDPGYCKEKSYDPKTATESLLVTPISKASAMQRSGRSGRTGPGQCYRLYTKDHFETELEENCIPEIQRMNLASVVLTVKKALRQIQKKKCTKRHSKKEMHQETF